MMVRRERSVALLRRAREDAALAATIDPARRNRLERRVDPELAALAREAFGSSASGSRREIIAAYRPALELPAHSTRGEAVFRRECASCHQIGAVGHAVGPNLASSSNRDPDALLVHILDPNRYVMPEHLLYQASDTQGRVYAGLVAGQTATSLTLLHEEGRTETILRQDIAQAAVTEKSLMPEGFEARITLPEMADLIGFLLDVQSTTPAEPMPLGIGTLPGLTEPEAPKGGAPR
jgi:putative heme-binding domain-containing protein